MSTVFGVRFLCLKELLHVATKKGPLLALQVGGVAMFYLLIRQVALFLSWWAQFHIERRARTSGNNRAGDANGNADGQAANGNGTGNGSG
ncbi:hypothetical protein E8E15_011084 [Penicillium rubens]|uniref:uncharacterized protein n=1 Tax=Penicillium rubens TaxID=1108849 RepID=UPI001D5941BE|nr:uncharacterized protein N7525_005763 [Penicillium rubens]KAF3030027.1 hypothetical protein E8E15_011084 [Penicillium rubens]KAJ5043604.1 hypothetical protein NUH16_000393 [Penicillium rubens]KAJ5840575.1 hypothetical protein N7525_005763 [Penicillium rubens]KAJ5868553.1 hypothetical protein N7534_003106 [Penicillium rubens]